jgi:pyruvate dehydrogenase E1 component
VWSVTSFSELARDAAAVEREARLAAAPASPRRSYIDGCLPGAAPIVAATDYVRAVPQMIASHLPGRRFIALGTDGFGRSDTRAALRAFFEVDRASIVRAAQQALAETGSPGG